MLPFPKCLPPIIFLCSYLQSAISIAIAPSALSEDLALVVGGGEGREVEVWSPTVNCSLPNFPDLGGYWQDLSLDLVGGQFVACRDFDCVALVGDAWEGIEGPELSRVYHTSAVTSRGLLLIGGYNSPGTTELLQAGQTFPLTHNMDEHCSIQVSESTIVLTGGRITLNLVTEYSGLETGGWEVSSKQLASLGTGRRQHACGSYPGPEGQLMLIVTGGWDAFYQATASTEVFNYSQEGEWRMVNPLPSGRYGLRGVSFANLFHVTGGYSPGVWQNPEMFEVLSWDSVAESWQSAGNLTVPRQDHAVTVAPMEMITDYCSKIY